MAKHNDSTKNENNINDDWLDDNIVNDSDDIETDSTQQENLPLPYHLLILDAWIGQSENQKGIVTLDIKLSMHTLLSYAHTIKINYSCMCTTYFCNIGDVTYVQHAVTLYHAHA